MVIRRDYQDHRAHSHCKYYTLTKSTRNLNKLFANAYFVMAPNTRTAAECVVNVYNIDNTRLVILCKLLLQERVNSKNALFLYDPL